MTDIYKEKPYLIIGGASKAGTTFLFDYLSQHPQLCESTIKEVRFFQNVNFGKEIEDMKEYYKYFIPQNSNFQSFLEGSPGYLYGAPKICSVIRKNIKNVKLIFIVREPTARFVSYFKHLKNHMEIESSLEFEKFTEIAFNKHNDPNISKIEIEGDTVGRSLRAGLYAKYLEYWLQTFNSSEVKVIFFEEMIKNPSGYLKELCEWTGIDPLFYENFEFKKVNRSIVPKNKTIHKVSFIIRRKIRNFIPKKLKTKMNSAYQRINESSEKIMINEDSKDRVQVFYKKHNLKLRSLLQEYGYKNFPDWL